MHHTYIVKITLVCSTSFVLWEKNKRFIKFIYVISPFLHCYKISIYF